MSTTVLHGALPGGVTDPRPRIEWFPARDNTSGIGLVVFAGGAYCGHAPHEGRGYAEWFQQHGITCFVAEYRVGPDGLMRPRRMSKEMWRRRCRRVMATAAPWPCR